MRSFRYLVVGAGMSGDAVCKGIRDADPDGSIGLVGEEEFPPYKRPPLTKGLWKGGDESKIWMKLEHGAELVLGRRIVSLDLDAHTARDDSGEEYSYERLVLATGGTPRRLPNDDDRFTYYRTLADYHRVRDESNEGKRFLVVGGGFIGSEIAAALKLQGRDVTMVFPEEGIGWRTFPPDLSRFVAGYYRDKGVEVNTEAKFESAEGYDAVIAGLGIVPRTDLAEATGLPVDDGIIVDEYGRVDGRDDVFAAGDVARFPYVALGKAARVEHEDHANTHGRHVGANAAGASKAYDHLPFFYSDLFDLGYEAVGDLDSRQDHLDLWLEPNKKGIVAYVDDAKRPRGFLLWNVWDKLDAARELIRAGNPIDEEGLRGLAG
ncbi:MAG TPA: FAD/NAD(P)-binding oxidoreductase [Gaiellaceae bacterium]|jgi:NADPH-dependent 2,4-dienoyl-CoA reductase/sulfur reductase-like enzyme